MVKKFRKKPVIIEAIRYYDDSADVLEAIQKFTGLDPLRIDFKSKKNYGSIIIPTLEGEMRAMIGDYIIKGVNGEFYPCKSDIFWKTYDEVKE